MRNVAGSEPGMCRVKGKTCRPAFRVWEEEEDFEEEVVVVVEVTAEVAVEAIGEVGFEVEVEVVGFKKLKSWKNRGCS